MSLFNNYNRNTIKLIYSGVYETIEGKDFLLNGLPAAINEYILNEFKKDFTLDHYAIIEKLRKQNESVSWAAHVTHKNFYDYYKKFNGLKNIITPNDIVNDGAIYIYPVELCITPNSIYNNYSIKLNGIEYTYNFIDALPYKVLSGLRSGKIKLLLNYIHDPIFPVNLDDIERFFDSNGISGDNIIIIAGNTLDHNYAGKIKITNGYIVLDQLSGKFNEYPRIGSLGYKSEYVKPKDLDVKRIRSKKFICMNRNMHRNHRWLSAYMAIKYNLLADSIFSFVALHDYAGNKRKIKEAIERFVPADIDDLDSTVDSIMEVIPLEIDTAHLAVEEKNGFNLNNNNKLFYSESYINIVNETVFEFGGNAEPFISEKTFHHPIINLQPFIVIGHPFTLQTLRTLGFKTFSPFINEDYDKCIDHVKRFELIESEIRRLSALSLSEIHDIYYQLKNVLIYNQNHAKTFGEYNPFEKTFSDIRKWYLK